MPDYGLTSAGFVVKTQENIQDEVDASLQTTYGNSMDMTPGSALGQWVGIFTEREALVWELAQTIASMFDPTAATNSALDALCALTGTFRIPAQPSTVTLTLTGTPSTTVTAGSRATITSSGALFATAVDVTLGSLPAWTGTHGYVVGDRVTNSSRTYVCITAGTSAGSGGPTTTASSIHDGSVYWEYMGDGTAAVDVAASCTVTGPTIGLAGTINSIDTPVSGWNGVINLLDATLGTNLETDQDLRLRRELEIAGSGASTVNAITAALLKIQNVTAVTLFQNLTDTTDANGTPPHSIQVMVRNGDSQQIANTIFSQIAAGINPYGTTTETVKDSQGNQYIVGFTRPSNINIYCVVHVTKDPNVYPTDGDTEIQEAIVAYGQAIATGYNVVSTALSAQCFKVPGVLDITAMYIGTAPSPGSSTTINITPLQLAVFDSSRISVTSIDGTP